MRDCEQSGYFKLGASCRCLRSIESVAYIHKLLRQTTHNGFPVVQGGPESSDARFYEREGPLQGLILRSQLLVLLENKVPLTAWVHFHWVGTCSMASLQ